MVVLVLVPKTVTLPEGRVAIEAIYPVLDIALLTMALTGMFMFLEGRLGRVWMLVSIGVFFLTLADLVYFAYPFYTGHPLELLWLYGYLFIALAFRLHLKVL
jgi:hypothetical protein